MESLPSQEREIAVGAAVRLLREYSKEFENQSTPGLWYSIGVKPRIRGIFIQEAVRQWTQAGTGRETTETGYQAYLDGGRYWDNLTFFQKMRQLVSAGVFGTKLRDEINATKAALRK